MSESVDSFYYYRLALGRWQAKNNFLLEKYRRILHNVALTEFERNTIEGLLDDLSAPADSFLLTGDFHTYQKGL